MQPEPTMWRPTWRCFLANHERLESCQLFGERLGHVFV